MLRTLADEAGAVMVEFAVVAAIFVAVLLGIFEFGYAAWAKSSVAADAREGARYAMVRGANSPLGTADSASVANYVKTKTSLDQSIQVITSWSPSKAAGSKVTVTVKHLATRRGPLLATRTDSASSTMIVVY
jgi:Flp pilus assembly protein TadG